jgi:hypothetical protein
MVPLYFTGRSDYLQATHIEFPTALIDLNADVFFLRILHNILLCS